MPRGAFRALFRFPSEPPAMMAKALELWAREEMELPPSACPSPAALRRLCSGPTAPIWDFVTRHARNSRNVKKIRGNLRWYRHLQELEGAVPPPRRRGALGAAVARIRQELRALGAAMAGAQETAQRLESSLGVGQSRRWAELRRGAELRLLGAEPGSDWLSRVQQGALKPPQQRPGQSWVELSAILASGAEPEVLVSIKALCKSREAELQWAHPSREPQEELAEAHDWLEQAEALLIGHSPEAVLWALEALANQSTRELLAGPTPSAEAPPTLRSLVQESWGAVGEVWGALPPLLSHLRHLRGLLEELEPRLSQDPRARLSLIRAGLQGFLGSLSRELRQLQGNLPKSPQKPPKSPQKPPKSPQKPPKSPQKPPKSPQKPPKSPQKPPKSPQKPPKSPQKPPKSPRKPPKSPQKPPKSPQKPPKSPQKPPKSPQKPPKSPQKPEISPKSPPKFPKSSQKLEEFPKSPPKFPKSPKFPPKSALGELRKRLRRGRERALWWQQRLRFLSSATRGRRAGLRPLQEQVLGVARLSLAPPPLEGEGQRRRSLVLGALGALGEPLPHPGTPPPLHRLSRELGAGQGALLSRAAILRQRLRQERLRLRRRAWPQRGAEPEQAPPPPEGPAELLPRLRLVSAGCQQRIRSWPRLQGLLSQWWAQPAQWALATPPGHAPFSHWLQRWRNATAALQATPTAGATPTQQEG